jgi:putative ABC transport system substrate-binding protein
LSYAASQRDIAQRVAYMADRILRGEKPAQIPVEQPASFELAINLRSARVLGLAVPQSLLLRATDLIE